MSSFSKSAWFRVYVKFQGCIQCKLVFNSFRFCLCSMHTSESICTKMYINITINFLWSSCCPSKICVQGPRENLIKNLAKHPKFHHQFLPPNQAKQYRQPGNPWFFPYVFPIKISQRNRGKPMFPTSKPKRRSRSRLAWCEWLAMLNAGMVRVSFLNLGVFGV